MPQIDRAISHAEDELLAASNMVRAQESNMTRLVEVYVNERRAEERKLLFHKIKMSIMPGIYELHKSTSRDPKLYTVLGVGDHTENGSLLVTCIAHYAPHKGDLCYRPLLGEGGFLTPVRKMTHEDPAVEYYVPRFKFLTHLPQSFEHFVEFTTG